jgi:Xaa-Pro aminopeptidase
MNKLNSLREFLKNEDLTAFIIPRADEFQNEYIAPYADRLQWLTGFRGSAGTAVITLDKAAFFTDSRYIIQAKEEVPSVYEIHLLSQKTPFQWISETLLPHEKVGYDPRLFTETQLKRFDRPLVPLHINPIDQLWVDRPHPPLDFIRVHPLSFAGESDESKRKRIGTLLQARQCLITACDSIAWLLNIRGNDLPHIPIVQSACLLRKDGSYDLFVDLNKLNGQVFNHIQQGNGRAIDIQQLPFHLQKLDGSCQLDPHITPVHLIQTLEQAGVNVLRAEDPCILPKALKNDVEIQGAIQAHLQDGLALCRFFAWLDTQSLKGETTELSAAKKLYEFRKEGQHFKNVSFETISAVGAHGAIVHYRVSPESDIPLEKNDLYLIDSGGQYLTGTTDVTRTFAIGTPTMEQKDRFTRVLKGHIAIAQLIFPHNTAGIQIDALARQYLWQVGADYEHGTGHGVGSYLSVHEGPQRISKWVANTPLQPGMILSNEPGYYQEGSYGIRIESLVRVIEMPNMKGFCGFETLTLVPIDLELIDFSLLTNPEKLWINSYHQRVFNTLSPHLDEETNKWLNEKTRSL